MPLDPPTEPTDRVDRAERLLAGEPSSSAWSQVCTLVEDLDPAAVARLLPAARRWPAALRELPDSWWRAYTTGVRQPWFALAANRRLARNHTQYGPVALAAAPDLGLLALADGIDGNRAGGDLELWDTRGRQLRAVLVDGGDFFGDTSDLAFAADGSFLVAGLVRAARDGSVALFDPAGGERRWTVPLGGTDEDADGADDWEQCRVAVDPTGCRVAATSTNHGRLVVVRADDGHVLLDDPRAGASGPVALSVGGARVAVAAHRRLVVRDVSTGDVLADRDTPVSVQAVGFSPAGDAVAVAGAASGDALAVCVVPLDGGDPDPVVHVHDLPPHETPAVGLPGNQVVWTAQGLRVLLTRELRDDAGGYAGPGWFLLDGRSGAVHARGSGTAWLSPDGRAVVVDGGPEGVGAVPVGGLLADWSEEVPVELEEATVRAWFVDATGPAVADRADADPFVPAVDPGDELAARVVTEWAALVAARDAPADAAPTGEVSAEVVAAVAAAYRAAGLMPPERVVRVDSPRHGCAVAVALVAGGSAHPDAPAVTDPAGRALLDDVGTGWPGRALDVWDRVLERVLGTAEPGYPLPGQDALPGLPGVDAVTVAWSLVWEPVLAAVRDEFGSAFEDHLMPYEGFALRQAVNEVCWPDAEAVPVLAALDALARAGDPAAAPVRGLVRAVLTVGCWWWPFERLALVCAPPSVLRRDADGRLHADDGPAVAWPDGFAVHARHGVAASPGAP